MDGHGRVVPRGIERGNDTQFINANFLCKGEGAVDFVAVVLKSKELPT